MLKALAIATALSAVLAAGTAEACRIRQPMRFGLIQSATAVVIGEVRDYRRIPDLDRMADAREQLERSDLSPAMRASYELEAEFSGWEARFTIDVREVVTGNVARSIEVIWQTPNRMLVESLEGSHVIALTDRPYFPSADAAASQLYVVEQPCGASAVFEADSDMAHIVLSIARGETIGGAGDTIGF